VKSSFKKIPDEEWTKAREGAWKAIMAADYEKAMRFLTPVYKKYPKDFRVINFYASTLADFGELQPETKKKAFKKRGCYLLFGLLKRLRGVSRAWSYNTRNEYYYHSAKFDKQYSLGCESVKCGEKSGYYSQGVGAAWHAYGHARKGCRRFAVLWAKRSVMAWENYFKFKADYYNAYVHYALALGILGRIIDMEAALKKSAKLSGKPASYPEFKDIRDKIADLLLTLTRPPRPTELP
jgi:tetratricopeptide (TPR) repeat protein